MEFRNVLLTAAKTVEDRNTSYGTHDECFSRIAKLASAFFDEEIDEYKIAMILVFVKLGRIGDNRQYDDNYVDGVNYLAFASHFAGLPTETKKTHPPAFKIPQPDFVSRYALTPDGARGAE